MRTISLRQFRDSIPNLREQVEVTRRTQDGHYETLGQWTPFAALLPEPPAEVNRYRVEHRRVVK